MRLNNFTKEIIVFLFLVFIVTFNPITIFAQNKVIAIVNNDIITQKDLDDFINFMRVQLLAEYRGKDLDAKVQSMKLNLLDKLIEDRLILQEAKRTLEGAKKNKDFIMMSRLDIDQNRIKARIEEIKKKFDSDMQFQNSLVQQGLVQADLETRIKEQLLMYNIIDIKVKNKIVVNPAEVTDFYEKNKGEFKSPEQREFESMVVEDKKIAIQIYSQLKNGRSFDDLSKEYSIEVQRFNVVKGELRKDVEDIVFVLDINDVSEPIQIENGFSVFKIYKIIPSQQQSLNEVQDTIYSYLFEKKMQEGLASWLDELRKCSYIKISSD